MRQGSVMVAPGDPSPSATGWARSAIPAPAGEPHLHIHAQRPAAEGAPPISGDPLALRIDGRFLVRGDRLTGRDG